MLGPELLERGLADLKIACHVDDADGDGVGYRAALECS
jgi:hypothetical protein